MGSGNGGFLDEDEGAVDAGETRPDVEVHDPSKDRAPEPGMLEVVPAAAMHGLEEESVDELLPADWNGDAPVAVALDAAPPKPKAPRTHKRKDTFEIQRVVAASTTVRTPRPDRRAAGPSMTVAELARQAEHARVTGSAPPPPVAPLTYATEGERQYPQMLALLRGSEAQPPPQQKPKVPGTFFPSRPPAPQEEALDDTDLDTLLATMAEGLLVGGQEGENSEVVITLRDEFFQGTEIRISVHEDGVRARLVPPDRLTYRHLTSEMHRLERTLEGRGLRVSALVVEEPAG